MKGSLSAYSCRLTLSIAWLVFLMNWGFAVEGTYLKLEKGWEYRWGDSSFLDGKPMWTFKESRELWKTIDFPSNPPERNGQHNVWYRIKCPDQPELGSTIFISSIDLIAECYLESELIYHYGKFKPDGTGEFEGWPWHCIRLPKNFAGKMLYFRVYSDYPDIGLWGEISLAGEADHIQNIIKSDLPRFSVGLFFIFFGILLIFLSFYRLRGALFLMGVFLLNLGIIPIDTSSIKQLLIFAPVMWQFLGAANYFMLPITTAGLIHVLYGAGKWNIVKKVWMIHLAFLAYAMIFSMMGWIHLSSTYIHFDILGLCTLLAMGVSLWTEAKRGTANQKILTLGYGVMYLLFVYNGMIAHDMIAYESSSEFIGPAFMAVCFGLILVRKYNELHHGLLLRTEQLNQALILEEKLRAEANASSKAKGIFLANMSHELRTPMNGIMGMSQILMSTPLTGEQKDLSKTIFNSSESLLTILNDILDFSKIEANQMSVSPSLVELKEFSQKIIQIIQLTAKDKNLKLELNYDEKLPACVEVDPVRLRQVLLNLLGNAIKFTPEGKVQLKMEAGESDANGVTVLFVVEDSGIGIAAENIEVIFHTFTQVDGSASRQFGGTGLGLPISKSLVKLLGGELKVKSELEKGSQFYFELKLPVVKKTETVNTSEGEGLSFAITYPNAKILLVEDNPINMKVAIAMLKKFNIQPDLACNGQEAVDKVSDRAYDLILMDCQMPVLDGYEATKCIRAREVEGQHVLIVALTANSMIGDREDCLKAGMDDFMSKPVKKQSFNEIFAKYLKV